LPFYEIDEYYEEEINSVDIQFLIWYFQNTIEDEKFMEPLDDCFLILAKDIFKIFEEAWESAPENKLLRTFYTIVPNIDEFYEARNLIHDLLFKSYLFYTDTTSILEIQNEEIFQKNRHNEHLLQYLNENIDNNVISLNTQLFSLTGKQWVAEILGSKHSLSSEFLNISQKLRGYFFYKGQNQTDVLLEHIASGKQFKLTKKSFDHYENLNSIDTILQIGLVNWKSEWWFSGVYFQTKHSHVIVEEEKNSSQSKMAVNFLENQSTEVTEILEKQFKAFIEFTKGAQILFMPADKLESYVKAFIKFYNNSIEPTVKATIEARDNANKEGFSDSKKQFEKISKLDDSAIIFFNPRTGLEMAYRVNSAFPMENNPYFDKKLSEVHCMDLLMHKSFSTELARFCIDNCAEKLPFFSTNFGICILKDTDFLLRFWKGERYHIKHTITLSGGVRG